MATFQNIQDRVKTILIDLPAATLAEIPTLVNIALRDLQSKHNFWVMRKLQTANTAAATRNLVATPSDFKEYRLNPYYTENSGAVVRMEFAKSLRQLQGMFMVTDTGTPKYIRRGEASDDLGTSSLEVWPLSNSQSDYTAAPAGEYRITIPYWRFLPELSGSGDTNWFTNNRLGEQYLVHATAGLGFSRNWDTPKETEWFALAKPFYDQLVAEDKHFDFSGQDTFTPHQGVHWMQNTKNIWGR